MYPTRKEKLIILREKSSRNGTVSLGKEAIALLPLL
jgi:hypothetical protein